MSPVLRPELNVGNASFHVTVWQFLSRTPTSPGPAFHTRDAIFTYNIVYAYTGYTPIDDSCFPFS